MTNNIGHNSNINKETAELLLKYIEGVENYEGQIKELKASQKEIFDSAKAKGFDVKTIKAIIKIRNKDKAKLEEEEYLLDTYKQALDM